MDSGCFTRNGGQTIYAYCGARKREPKEDQIEPLAPYSGANQETPIISSHDGIDRKVLPMRQSKPLKSHSPTPKAKNRGTCVAGCPTHSRCLRMCGCAHRYIQGALFHHNRPVSAITDFQPAVGDNGA